jgi:hypothetical protein
MKEHRVFKINIDTEKTQTSVYTRVRGAALL